MALLSAWYRMRMSLKTSEKAARHSPPSALSYTTLWIHIMCHNIHAFHITYMWTGCQTFSTVSAIGNITSSYTESSYTKSSYAKSNNKPNFWEFPCTFVRIRICNAYAYALVCICIYICITNKYKYQYQYMHVYKSTCNRRRVHGRLAANRFTGSPRTHISYPILHTHTHTHTHTLAIPSYIHIPCDS